MTARPLPLTPLGWASPKGYSHGMIAPNGRVIVTAGQIGWDPTSGAFATDDFAEQCRLALANVVAVVREGGGDVEHIVRLTWYVTSRQEYLESAMELGRVYREVMGRHYPAMAVVVVGGLVEARAKVEIEGTAVVPIRSGESG